MRLSAQPVLATLNVDVVMQLEKARCKVEAGTQVEILGETVAPGRPRTGYLLVRATQGPCTGAREVVSPEQLTVVGPAQ